MANLLLVFRDIYEKFPINPRANLDFEKLESAVHLQFNSAHRDYLVRAADMTAYLRDGGCFEQPSPTELRQMFMDTAKHGLLFAQNSEKLARWFSSVAAVEPERPELLKSEAYLRSLSEQLRATAISLDEYCQSGSLLMPQRHAGRKSNKPLQFLVGHAYIAYRKAGGKKMVYWNDGKQACEGRFLDMVDELLRQMGWQQPRKTLGSFIYRNQAMLGRRYASLMKHRT